MKSGSSWYLKLVRLTIRYKWLLVLLLCASVVLTIQQSKCKNNYQVSLNVRDHMTISKNTHTNNNNKEGKETGPKQHNDVKRDSQNSYRPRGRCQDYVSDLPCQPNQPCQYDDKVDLRIIMLTYNRDISLNQSLHRLADLELDGYTGQIEIWLDCSKDGYVDLKTHQVALNYRWPHGKVRVHVWSSHVGLYGQWMDTWSPRDTEKMVKVKGEGHRPSEIALIVEDDLDVSPLAWRWIRLMRETFMNMTDIAGYSLRDDDITKNEKKVLGNDGIFLRRHTLPWGLAPEPEVWKGYQTWFHQVYNNLTFHPYVKPDKLHTGWFKMFEKRAAAKGEREASMWEMWFYYYMHHRDLLSVFPNARKLSGAAPVKGFELNRQEDGLHFHGQAKNTRRSTGLITTWDEKYVKVPERLKVLDYSGTGHVYKNYQITGV